MKRTNAKVKKVLVSIMILAMMINLVPKSVNVMAASKTKYAASQKGLDKALAGNYKTIIINSKKKKTFTVNGKDYSDKNIIIKSENATIKNYSEINSVTILGNNNSYFENGTNKSIQGQGRNTKIVLGNKAVVNSLLIETEQIYLQIQEQAFLGTFTQNKDNASIDFVVNGRVDSVDVKEQCYLKLSGETTNNINLKVEGAQSKIISSIPLNAEFASNAQLILKNGSEGSALSVTKDTVLRVNNYSKEDITINTPDGRVVIEMGKIGTTKVIKESDINPTPAITMTPTPTAAPSGIISSGAFGGSYTTPDELKEITLDKENAALDSNNSESTSIVVKTINQYNKSYYYNYTKEPVTVSLKEAALTDTSLKITDRGVSANADKYYSIARNTVTFYSKDVLAGEYTYEIAVGGFTKEFTLTVTGDTAQDAKTVLLPYSGDKNTPLEQSTIDAQVNSPADAEKTVSFAFYTKTGDCEPVYVKELMDETAGTFVMYKPNGVLYKTVYINFDDKEELNIEVTSLRTDDSLGDFVTKMETGTYQFGFYNDQGNYFGNLHIVDTQPAATLVQDETTATNVVKNGIDLDKAIYKYWYHYIFDKSDGSFTNDLSPDGVTRWMDTFKSDVTKTSQGYYTRDGLYQCCSIIYKGVQRKLSEQPYIILTNEIKADLSINNSEEQINPLSFSSNFKNKIQSVDIKKLTLYIDVSGWEDPDSAKPFYVPFTFKEPNIKFDFNEERNITEVNYLISTKHRSATYHANDAVISTKEIGSNALYIYFKIMEKKEGELSENGNFNNFVLTSSNIATLEISNQNPADQSYTINVHNKGVTQLRLKDATSGKVIKTIQVTVKDFDNDNYKAELSSDMTDWKNSLEVEWEKSSSEAKKISYRILDTNSKPLDYYVPSATIHSVEMQLKKATNASGSALSVEDIASINQTIQTDFEKNDPDTSKLVSFDRQGLLLNSGGETSPLAVGEYVFEVKFHGLSSELKVKIKQSES